MNFARMKREELLAVADDLGVSYEPDVERDALIKMLRAHEDKVAAEAKGFTVPVSKTAKKVRVFVPEDKDPSKNFPVMVCVNGQDWRVPRGKPCEVPDYIAEALANAVETTYRVLDEKNEDGSFKHEEINTNRFNAQIGAVL